MLSEMDDEGDRRILLGDFGIARSIGNVGGLTATNMTIGTVGYSAPEQLMGEAIDGRADQYALAATAYHLLTGSQLFANSNPAVVISRHLTAPVPSLAAIRPELAKFDPVFEFGLAKDPDARFRRCIDFARALADQAAADQQTPLKATAPRQSTHAAAPPRRTQSSAEQRERIQSPPEQVVIQPAQLGRPRKKWVIPSAVLVALSLVTSVLMIWRPWQERTASSEGTSTASEGTPSANSAAPSSVSAAQSHLVSRSDVASQITSKLMDAAGNKPDSVTCPTDLVAVVGATLN